MFLRMRGKAANIVDVGDAVCLGTLTILPPHLDYTQRTPEAIDFLSARIRAAQGA